MLNTTLRLHVLRDGAGFAVPPSTIPDVTAAPAYVYSRIFAFLSPRHPPHDLFPPLHRVSNRSFYSGTPYLHRHPTPTSDSRSSPRLTCPAIFPRLSTAILTFLQAVEPNLQRHPYVIIGFTFLSSSYITHHLFPSFYRHFHFSRSGGALPPTSPLHQHHHCIRLLALHDIAFFPASLPPF